MIRDQTALLIITFGFICLAPDTVTIGMACAAYAVSAMAHW